MIPKRSLKGTPMRINLPPAIELEASFASNFVEEFRLLRNLSFLPDIGSIFFL